MMKSIFFAAPVALVSVNAAVFKIKYNGVVAADDDCVAAYGECGTNYIATSCCVATDQYGNDLSCQASVGGNGWMGCLPAGQGETTTTSKGGNTTTTTTTSQGDTTTSTSTTSGDSTTTSTSTTPGSGPTGTYYRGVAAGGYDLTPQTYPGTEGTDYVAPITNDIDSWLSKDSRQNIMRLPFTWERICATADCQNGTKLDGPAANSIDSTIQHMLGKGITVLLDPHNNNDGVSFNGQTPTKEQLAYLWTALATQYKDDKVIMEIYNEPKKGDDQFSVSEWLEYAQAAMDAIRSTGNTNLVLVPGIKWTGAWSWTQYNDGMKAINDIANNYAFAMHQYFDDQYQGTAHGCSDKTGALNGVEDATAWLKENNVKGFMSEFNVKYDNPAQFVSDSGDSDADGCGAAVASMLSGMESSGQWLGYTVWNFAAWWQDMNMLEDGTFQMNYEWYLQN